MIGIELIKMIHLKKKSNNCISIVNKNNFEQVEYTRRSKFNRIFINIPAQ